MQMIMPGDAGRILIPVLSAHPIWTEPKEDIIDALAGSAQWYVDVYEHDGVVDTQGRHLFNFVERRKN